MLDERQDRNGLTVLTRLAQRVPEKRALLRKALDADLVTLAPLAARVGVETGEPMPSVLAQALAESSRGAEASARVAEILPLHSVSMREVAAQVLGERIRSRAPGSPDQPEALIDYAQSLADIGDPGQGAVHAKQAVALLRGRGDDQAMLARALWTASRCERLTGATAAALELSQEAVAVQRQLAGAAGSPGLGYALANLADALKEAGDDQEALARYGEAADLFRRLIRDAPRRLDYQLEDAAQSGKQVWINLTPGPGSPPAPAGTSPVSIDAAQYTEPGALQYGLAMALTACARLMVLDRPPAAEAAATEAVQLLTDLAADQPDAYRLALASALTAQAATLVERDAERARPPARKAAEIVQAVRDEGAAIADDDALLAAALMGLSITQMRLRLWEDALTSTRALDALGWLDQHSPDVLGSLARQFETLSVRLAEAGHPQAAVVAAHHAVAVARRLEPVTGPARDTMVGRALDNLSCRLVDAGDDAGALAASSEAMALTAPLFMRSEYGAQMMAETLSQYLAACDAAARSPDTTLPLASVILGLLRELDSSAAHLVMLAFLVLEAYRATDDVDTAASILDGLYAFTQAHNQERVLRRGYALPAFNVVHDLLGQDRPGEAESIVERLAGLCSAGDDIILRETGKAAFIVLATYADKHDLAAAARVARLGEAALRSEPYLAIRREDLEEQSPGPFLAQLDELMASAGGGDQAPADTQPAVGRGSRFRLRRRGRP